MVTEAASVTRYLRALADPRAAGVETGFASTSLAISAMSSSRDS